MDITARLFAIADFCVLGDKVRKKKRKRKRRRKRKRKRTVFRERIEKRDIRGRSGIAT